MSSVISFTENQNKSKTAGVTAQSSYGALGLNTSNHFQIYKTNSEKDRAEQATQEALEVYNEVLNGYTLPTFNEIAEADDLYDRTWNITASAQTQLGKTIRGAYQSAGKVEDLKSWEFANVVAEITGTTPEYAKKNMESLIKIYTGQDIDEATFANGLWKSAVSKIVSNIAGYRTQLFTSTLGGLSEREQQQRMENYVNNELSQYKPYWNPDMYGYTDSALGKFTYFMAENSSDVVESLIVGLLTGGVGSKLKLGANTIKFIDKLIRVSNTYFKEAGSAQMDMLEMTDVNGNRMSYDTIAKYSTTIGIVNTVFEFGLEKGFEMVGASTVQMKTAAKNLFKKYGKVSQKTIHDTAIETMSHYLGRRSWVTLKDSMAEGATEAMQTWSESFFTNLAYKKSEGFGDYVKSHKDILSEMVEVFTLTTLSTFVQAPLLNSTSSSNDGLNFLGYLKDIKTGNIVRVDDAQRYSKQTEGSTLVRMNDIYKTQTETNTKTDKKAQVIPQQVNVYKVGGTYVPATEADSLQVAKARGNTAGIYVNVVEGSVEGTPYNVESFTAQRSLGIQNKNIVGTSGNTVVVKEDNIASTVTNFMTSDNFVSAQFKQDGQVSTNGQFNEATITLKDSNGENRNIRIVTEDIATKENLTLKDYNQADREANEQFAKDVQERNEKNLNETVKEAKKYTPQELNEVFDKRTSTLSQEDKTATKSLRNKIYKILRQKKDDKNMSIRQATALANTSSTLVQTMASVNKMSVSQFVKERVGDNVADFIKIMTTEEKLANGNNPAFIVQNTDGTWTINLWLGDNTQSNLIHELGHMFVSTITDDSVLDEFKALYKNEFEKGGIMGEKFQERFCDDLEAYIASGKAQNEGLRAVFKQIVSAMTDFVKYIRGIEFNNKESVIRAFDNLFNVDTVENIQRVEDTDTALASIKETLTNSSTQLKNEIGEDSETINDLVSDINTTIDQLQDESTSENEKAQLWRELNDKAETLREELDSVEGEAVNSIREALSKEALANLMNNRPIASQQKYSKQASTPAGKDELLQYATSPVNEQPFIDKYRKDFISSKKELSFPNAKQNTTQQEVATIKQIAIEYPRHEVANGVYMLDGLSDDKHDMPMQKEFLTARLVFELLSEKLILLPRYMDRMLNRIAGWSRFDNYSLADGISAVNSEGKTYEFKFVSNFNRVIKRLNTASSKADVSVVVISSKESLSRVDVKNKFNGNGEVYLLNIYNPNSIEVRYKKEASTEWKLVHSDTKSELKLGDPSSIKNLASELKAVKPEDQTSMDYDVYNKNNNAPLRFNKLVYHGSGARFDAFDSDYMGTGEGGASKGAGQYMTDEEGRRYRKNVDKGDLDFTYYGSVLVPYTAQELIGRIRDGRPVESDQLQTVLDTNKSLKPAQRSAIEKELSAIRTLGADPLLNRTILNAFTGVAGKDTDTINKKLETDKTIFGKVYDLVVKKMQEKDPSFKFKTKDDGIDLIKRALNHSQWETEDTRNARFIESHQSKESIDELVQTLYKYGYFTNELKDVPLAAMTRLLWKLERDYGEVNDETYDNIRAEIANPKYTTLLRLASDEGLTFEDVNNTYNQTDVKINNEDFSKALHDTDLPKEWRTALQNGAYNNTLLQEMNDYVVKQYEEEEKNEAEIKDLTASEKQLKKDIRTIEEMYTSDIRSANKTISKYENTTNKLNEKLANLKADYEAKKIEAKEYERSVQRLENALRRVKATNLLMHIQVQEESVKRDIKKIGTLNRNVQDHRLGRNLQTLREQLFTPKQVLRDAEKNGSAIPLQADVEHDMPALYQWLQDKGILNEQGCIVNNINSLNFYDLKTLRDQMKEYQKSAREELSDRKEAKKNKAKTDARYVSNSYTIGNRWKLDADEQAELEKEVNKQIEKEKSSGVLSESDVETRKQALLLAGASEKAQKKADIDARPANKEYKKTQKNSIFKNIELGYDVPRRILRRINPRLEILVMGGYDEQGNEILGIEQHTNEQLTNIAKRKDGFEKKFVELYGDQLDSTKKGKKKTQITKKDIYNIFSKNASVLEDKTTYIDKNGNEQKFTIFNNYFDDNGEMFYEPSAKMLEYMKDGDPTISTVAKSIYNLAVKQDREGTEFGDEHYKYTMVEQMGIYLMLQQEGYVYALGKGNNLSASRMFNLFTKFVEADKDSDYGKARQLANYLQWDAQSRMDKINPISIKLDNKDMTEYLVYDYFGIFLDNAPEYDPLKLSLDGDGNRGTYKVNKSFLIERQGTTRALNLDILSTWEKQVQKQEHYIAFAEYFDNMRRVMQTEGQFEAIKRQNGDDVANWLNSFFRGIANSYGTVTGFDEVISKSLKFMRSNLAKSALSYNILPVATQVSTLSYALSEGIKAPYFWSAVKSVLTHPIQTNEMVKSLSAQMKAQKRLDTELAKGNDYDFSTKASNVKYGVDKFVEIGMQGLEIADLGVKNILWLSKYNQQLNYYNSSEDANIVKHRTDDPNYASKRAVYDADVFVLDSQQSTLTKNNPVAYQSNDNFFRQMLMFSSQSNKQLFYHLDNMREAKRNHIKGVIGRNIIGYSLAVALTCVIRGKGLPHGDDDEWQDWLLRAASAISGEVLTNIPVAGTLISQASNGWNNAVSVPIADVLQDTYNLATALFGEEKENGKSRWEKSLTALKNLVLESGGSIAGLPEAQLKKIYNAITDENLLKVLGYDWAEFYDSFQD